MIHSFCSPLWTFSHCTIKKRENEAVISRRRPLARFPQRGNAEGTDCARRKSYAMIGEYVRLARREVEPDGPQMFHYGERPGVREQRVPRQQSHPPQMGRQRAKSADSREREAETGLRQHARFEIRQSDPRVIIIPENKRPRSGVVLILPIWTLTAPAQRRTPRGCRQNR